MSAAFFRKSCPATAGVQLDKSFGKLTKPHGRASFECERAAVIEASTVATITRHAQLLQILGSLRDTDAQRLEHCVRLCEQMVHQIIDGNGCDCTHVTARRSRPYTLVCTTTTASYETACKIHQRDIHQRDVKNRLITLDKLQT